MKHATLIAAAALVLLANALALIHASRNRSGATEAEITLTDLELTYHRSLDDSGVSLRLRWVDPQVLFYSPELTPEDLDASFWLNRAKLEALGFDCSVEPADPKAYSFYRRQPARAGLAALEYDGPAWQAWQQLQGKIIRADRPPAAPTGAFGRELAYSTRLVVIDAGLDATVLRGRYPDRARVLILPAIIRIAVAGAVRPGGRQESRLARLTGQIQDIPSQIHVPKPHSDGFRALRKTSREVNSEAPLYRVRLRYGSLLEPWVAGVEFMEH